MAAVDDGGLGGAVGVVEVAETADEGDPGAGEVDGGLHVALAASRPLLLDLAPVRRPVLRVQRVAELLLPICNNTHVHG